MEDILFQNKLVRRSNGCLEWTGTRLRKNCKKDPTLTYGLVTRTWPKTVKSYLRKTVTFLAHRYAWFLEYGEWRKDQLLHDCDNVICCDVTHLFEGSNQDNINDKIQKGRQADVRELKNPNCQYSNKLIQTVRNTKGPTTKIAVKFGMSQSHVWNIKNNKARRI